MEKHKMAPLRIILLVGCLGMMGCKKSEHLLAPETNYLFIRLLHISEAQRLNSTIDAHREQFAANERKKDMYLDSLNRYNSEIAAWEERVKNGENMAAAHRDSLVAVREQLFTQYNDLIKKNNDTEADITRWEKEKTALISGHFPLSHVVVDGKTYSFATNATTEYALPLDLHAKEIDFALHTSAGTFDLHVSYDIEAEVVYKDEVSIRTVFKKSRYHSFDSIQIRCPSKRTCYTHDMLLALYF